MPALKNPDTLREVATGYLRDAVNNQKAEFRDGQWEGIEQAVIGNRVLIVQRTGWGKTMVYTIATKLRRERGAGPSLMISPLLALMRNQELAADSLGLTARRMTSDNFDSWGEISKELKSDEVDMLMITPERLANEGFFSKTIAMVKGGFGMLIIDEAHCISDWGHDFRPDYQRIRRIQQMIPEGAAIVATTATANDRVVEDIRRQLGEGIQVTRGSLIRHSLQLHNLKLTDVQARLAWIAQVIPHLPGSGIIYVLTRKDADLVTGWLTSKDIDACSYYGDTGEREELEEALLKNELKVLVATIALGMGFDKPDLKFIIHYQRPSSVVHYYQQVGRAGRGIKDAYGFLMWGKEDEQIADYFLDNAYPPQEEINEVLGVLEETDGGLTLPEIMLQANLKKTRIEKILKLASLESPAPVVKEKGIWFATGEADGFQIPSDSIARLRQIRETEQVQMREYMNHRGCLMAFLQRALDDKTAKECGRCRNCTGRTDKPYQPKAELVREAERFLGKRKISVYPNDRWPVDLLSDHPIHETDTIGKEYRAEWGIALCRAFEGDLSHQILKERRYEEQYSDQIVEAFVRRLKTRSPRFRCITYTPPHRKGRQHVPILARAVADRLDLQLVNAIARTGIGARQSEQKNPLQRAQNIAEAFFVEKSCKQSTILIDDIIVSGWTMTTIAALLRYDGCPAVLPATLIKQNLAE